MANYHINTSKFYKKPLIEAVSNSKTETIILSDSLLCHIWQHTENHFEQPTFFCLIGGKIRELEKIYSKLTNEPENIIVCAGVNNLPSQSSEQIINELQTLAKFINKENTVFCSLPYPPKFCEKNGIIDENMVKKISSINNYIRNFNKTHTKFSVNLHNYGSEFKNFNLHFKYNEWKEISNLKKLHFSSSIKKKIAYDISKISFPTRTDKKINLVTGHTSLPLTKDFIPKITPVMTAVRQIPGLVFKNNISNIRKISPHKNVVCSLQDKVNVRILS